MSTHRLTPITRGDHSPPYTFTLTRPGTPELDLTENGTEIRFGAARRGQTTLVFEKTIGEGVEVTGENTCVVSLEPADTVSLPNTTARMHVLDCELEVTEADGRVTTPWHGTLTVRQDVIT